MTLDELLRQGKSAAQGASNGIASQVSGPVDMLAWLLRKGGVPVGQAPIGGSEWMKNKGLTAEPENRMAGLLGEGLGLAGSIIGPAKAPQIARGLLQMGDNLAAPVTANKQLGAIVYHGSPHKFDKFDSSKIGTGEGAQAYGHGMYLAESPEVAGAYQKTLANDGFLVGDKVFDPASLQHMNVRSVARKGDVDAAIAKAQELASSGSPVANMAAQDLARLQEIKAAGGLQKNTGSLYKVDLPDEHIAKMLDWDKPLSQQGKEVQQAVKNFKGQNWWIVNRDLPGSSVLKKAHTMGQDEFISGALQQQGIPGIRYLDGGSRSAGAGSSNFVVFPGNEGLLNIVERNGEPVNNLVKLLKGAK